MEASKIPFLFPLEKDEQFKRHTIALAKVMGDAMNKYLDEHTDTPESRPSAHSIGTACYLIAHLSSLGFEDSRKEQVIQGLVASLVLNGDSGLLSLAQSPTLNEKSI